MRLLEAKDTSTEDISTMQSQLLVIEFAFGLDDPMCFDKML